MRAPLLAALATTQINKPADATAELASAAALPTRPSRLAQPPGRRARAIPALYWPTLPELPAFLRTVGQGALNLGRRRGRAGDRLPALLRADRLSVSALHHAARPDRREQRALPAAWSWCVVCIIRGTFRSRSSWARSQRALGIAQRRPPNRPSRRQWWRWKRSTAARCWRSRRRSANRDGFGAKR